MSINATGSPGVGRTWAVPPAGEPSAPPTPPRLADSAHRLPDTAVTIVALQNAADASFPFDVNKPPPSPDTREPALSRDEVDARLREAGLPAPPAGQLKHDHWKAGVAASGAWLAGYPLAGELLGRFLDNTGAPVVLPVTRAGASVVDVSQGWRGLLVAPDGDYQPQAPARQQLLLAVRRYFDTHAHADALFASTPWRPMAAIESDPSMALGRYYQKLQGVFVAQRDGTGKVVGISGRIQSVAYDYYDFGLTGRSLEIPVLGSVPRHHLWLMQYDGWAQGFPVWMVGPVGSVRGDAGRTGWTWR